MISTVQKVFHPPNGPPTLRDIGGMLVEFWQYGFEETTGDIADVVDTAGSTGTWTNEQNTPGGIQVHTANGIRQFRFRGNSEDVFSASGTSILDIATSQARTWVFKVGATAPTQSNNPKVFGRGSGATTSRQWFHGFHSGSDRIRNWCGGSHGQTNHTVAAHDVVIYLFDGTTGHESYVNGTTLTDSDTDTNEGYTGSFTPVFGARGWSGSTTYETYDNDVLYCALFNKELSSAERTKVYDFLKDYGE